MTKNSFALQLCNNRQEEREQRLNHGNEQTKNNIGEKTKLTATAKQQMIRN